jgi:hypothetical protein
MQDQTKQYPHTLGNAYGFHNKRLAGKAIRKSMKTKGEKFAMQRGKANTKLPVASRWSRGSQCKRA